MLDGNLYVRMTWSHNYPTDQDVDNIAKRILLMSSDSVTHKCPVKMSPGPTRP